MGKLILIRHGETNKNANNSLHSTKDQESLNERGITQINKVADRLKHFSSIKLYSSNEKRAIESTQILSKALSMPFVCVEGMQERNWGIFTGKPWTDVQKILNAMNLDERYNYIPPEGESWKDFETRLIRAIEKISENIGDHTVVVITHGGAIRALLPYLLKIPREESFKYDPNNASLSIFNYENSSFSKIAINDTSHLA